MRVLWQTEAGGQTAQLRAGDGRAALVWPGGELAADTVEDVLLLAADARLSPKLYARLLGDLELVAGGPGRAWEP